MSQQLPPARRARPLRTLACLAALCALGLQIGPAPALAAAKRTLGAATPEALVERMNAATAKKDFSEMLACITPDDRAQMVGALLVGTVMMGAFMQMGGDMAMGMAEGMQEGLSGEEATPAQKAEMAKAKKEMEAQAAAWQKKYEGTLRKHNLEEMLSEDAELPAGEGPAALRALLKDTDEIALFEDLLGLLKDSGKGEVKEDAAPPGLPAEPIKGLKVQGDRASAQAGTETVEMVKIDGRWYVKVPEKKEEAAPTAPGR
jgi:hypothetical protein